MNTLSPEKKVAILSALVEGCSLRSVSRMTNTHRTTIMRLLSEIGQKCTSILDEKMRGLSCQVLEFDEVWSFVLKKERRLTDEEKLRGDIGDQYDFVCFDPDSKLVPVFVVGKRDSLTTRRFVQEV